MKSSAAPPASGTMPAPLGAHVGPGGVTFRVWAPKVRELAVVLQPRAGGPRSFALAAEAGAPGFFAGTDATARAGDRYRYRLGDILQPDPASRFQPDGVEGCSQIVDPAAFAWQAAAWRRPPLRGRVIYELHVGTFTAAGTFAAAREKLPALADLGVNALELMPLADFAGNRNWGYDGVMPFAPAHGYGTPDELRALIDAAHQHGLAVIVDVVYNHLGPSGNPLPAFSDDYFHRASANLWGQGLNFDGANAGPVRDFFLQNAAMWFDEYRVDGLRLDATHAIADTSQRHLIAEIAALAHARGGFTIAEDERNDAQLLRPAAEGGLDVDGGWADDFHHTVRVALTGDRHAHFANYTGSLDETVETLRHGWFYRGQFFPSWQRPRGTPADDLAPERFVFCISNHDQVGNRPRGERLSEVVSPAAYRAASALLCLAPYTPLLFQGQEWAATARFPFFTDYPGGLGADIAENRRREFAHVGATWPPDVLAAMPDPQAESTFVSAKLDWSERAAPQHAGILALYKTCLGLRRDHAIFQSAPRDRWRVEALARVALALRWDDAPLEWRLVVCLRDGFEFAPPDDRAGWERVLDSNDARFGGDAAPRSPGAILWRRSSAISEQPR